MVKLVPGPCPAEHDIWKGWEQQEGARATNPSHCCATLLYRLGYYFFLLWSWGTFTSVVLWLLYPESSVHSTVMV